MIVADTGAVVGLLDGDDRHHGAMRDLFLEDPAAWVLPWAILPEVDYLVTHHLGTRVAHAFLEDLANGAYLVEWGGEADLARALEITTQYRSLEMGLVDAAVMATAERLGARAIATLDLRHFGAVTLRGSPLLLPRDV